MRLIKSFALLLFLGSSFLACKKDHNNTTNHSGSEAFIGKWKGNYGFDDNLPGYFFSLNIKSDGVIQELNSSGVAKGEGTWNMQGSLLKGVYTMKFSPYNKYSVLVSVNASTGKLEGTWGYDDNGTDGGKILLSKD
jgi:hypothetical protein